MLIKNLLKKSELNKDEEEIIFNFAKTIGIKNKTISETIRLINEITVYDGLIRVVKKYQA